MGVERSQFVHRWFMLSWNTVKGIKEFCEYKCCRCIITINNVVLQNIKFKSNVCMSLSENSVSRLTCPPAPTPNTTKEVIIQRPKS